MIALADIEAARARIKDHVRATPVLAAVPYRTAPITAGDLWLKLESHQVTGSFKARGAVNTVLGLEAGGGLVTASSGNHGIGVAYAGLRTNRPVRVYLPANAPDSKAQRLRYWHAEVIRTDGVWDNANQAALDAGHEDSLTYIHPFADPNVIAGQGTVGLELVEQIPDVDLIIAAIGGGGLTSGIALAAKSVRPTIEIIGVEPVGAATLHDSLDANEVIELADITTDAASLAPRRSHRTNLDIIRAHVAGVVLVTDDDLRTAAGWLWRECGIAAEIGAAAPIAALMTGKISTRAGQRVCAVISGSGTDGIHTEQAS